jgi:hypothetical protein
MKGLGQFKCKYFAFRTNLPPVKKGQKLTKQASKRNIRQYFDEKVKKFNFSIKNPTFNLQQVKFIELHGRRNFKVQGRLNKRSFKS